MAVLAECLCHKKQSLRNKVCSCGQDLVKLKKSNKINYWIVYRLPGGKQRFEKMTGENAKSLEYARDVEGKRRVQKRENRIFDIKPELNMTFKELSEWYLGFESVKKLHSYSQISNSLRKFNLEFGERMVKDIKPSELDDYKAKRKNAGSAESTIDAEIGSAKTVVIKAFFDRKVDDDTFKNFKQIKKYLTGKRRNSNARKRVLSHKEFLNILEHLPLYSRGVFLTGYYTGMRLEEPLSLTWDMVSLKDRKITLPKEITKDDEERVIPIGDSLYSFLKKIPTPIHDNHVFLNNGKPIKYIRRGLSNACKKAEVIYGRFVKDGFVFHDTRHTFVTNMRKAGVHNDVTNAITGHSDPTMRSRYDTVSFEDMMEGIRKLEAYLGNVDQSVDQTPFLSKTGVNQKAANLLN